MKNDDISNNCKKLIYAIMLSDNEKVGKKSIICVYDTKDNDRLVAVFNNSTNCGNLFSMKRTCIDSYVCKKQLIKSRFRLERLVIDDE